MIEPFDISKAKAGAEIMIGIPAKVRILDYERDTTSPFKILALITFPNGETEERVYNERGFTNQMHSSIYDLRLKI